MRNNGQTVITAPIVGDYETIDVLEKLNVPVVPTENCGSQINPCVGLEPNVQQSAAQCQAQMRALSDALITGEVTFKCVGMQELSNCTAPGISDGKQTSVRAADKCVETNMEQFTL